MTDAASDLPEGQEATPCWRPLASIDQRVLGVLVEKAKTTPDIYPLSLNAITAACNQKSNRDPQMNLATDDVEESLDRLRQSGAVGIIEGIARARRKPEAPMLTRARIKFLTLNLDFSIAKAKEKLGYRPRVDFSEGMRRALDWAAKTGSPGRQPGRQPDTARFPPDTVS